MKGKLTFYCRMLHVSRQAFYKYLQRKDRPWKYQKLADEMMAFHPWSRDNNTIHLYRKHLRVANP